MTEEEFEKFDPTKSYTEEQLAEIHHRATFKTDRLTWSRVQPDKPGIWLYGGGGETLSETSVTRSD